MIKPTLRYPCVNCNSNTPNRCIICKRFLCNRCKSRKAIYIPLSGNTIPKGICQKCKKTLLIEGTLKSGEAFQKLIINLTTN